MQEQETFIHPEHQVSVITWREAATHTLLFILTFLTTSLAGVGWLNKDPFELSNFVSGIPYAALLMFMLSAHEFGHYFAARHHGIRSTLPFFIPFPSVFGFLPFGTLGAVIRLRSAIPSRRVIFDIGAAGPIAGFVASLIILLVGFRTLPPIEYLYGIHPEYAQMATIPSIGLTFGNSAFYSLLARVVAPPGSFVPPMNEIYHYPFLCVGWFGLFVTMLNLVPVAQLDGGHICYAMFGVRYHRIAQIALIILVVLGTAGFLPLFGISFEFGWAGWLFWALMLVLFMRAFRMNRPAVEDDTPLDSKRLAVGWLCIVIFAGSFSISPFTLQ